VLWGIYGQGIHTQYTTQLDLVDGIIIGDPRNPVPAYLADDGAGRGLGVSQNPPAQNLRFERLWIEGFRRGFRVPEAGIPSDPDGTGSRPTPLSASRLADVHFENVDYIFAHSSVPWRSMPLRPGVPFPDHFELSRLTISQRIQGNAAPIPSFSSEPLGHRGIVLLDASASRDPDAAPALSITGNGIVAYAWDFDGDGQIDAHGRQATCRVEPGTEIKVSLQVWDHQGASATTARRITAQPADYPELLVDSGFDGPAEVPPIWMLDASRAGDGWFGAGNIRRTSGRVELRGESYGHFSIGQIVHDRRNRIGRQEMSWRALHEEGGGRTNVARIEVWGVDGECRARHWGGEPEPIGTIPNRCTPLAAIDLPVGGGWRPGSTIIDFGEGFDFIVVSVYGRGFDGSDRDRLFLDQLSIVGEVD
jgi:hypothetical protein